jgi:hypothetical protein
VFSVINAEQKVNMQIARKENKRKYECNGGGFKPPKLRCLA